MQQEKKPWPPPLPADWDTVFDLWDNAPPAPAKPAPEVLTALRGRTREEPESK